MTALITAACGLGLSSCSGSNGKSEVDTKQDTEQVDTTLRILSNSKRANFIAENGLTSSLSEISAAIEGGSNNIQSRLEKLKAEFKRGAKIAEEWEREQIPEFRQGNK